MQLNVQVRVAAAHYCERSQASEVYFSADAQADRPGQGGQVCGVYSCLFSFIARYDRLIVIV